MRFIVHENFHWQPSYNAIKKVQTDENNRRVHSPEFPDANRQRLRAGTYLARQHFFRGCPRLLLYKTECASIDTFRYLLGEINDVFAQVHRLNAAIEGEDTGQLFLHSSNGATAMWSANR